MCVGSTLSTAKPAAGFIPYQLYSALLSVYLFRQIVNTQTATISMQAKLVGHVIFPVQGCRLSGNLCRQYCTVQQLLPSLTFRNTETTVSRQRL